MTLLGCDVARYQALSLVPWGNPRLSFGIVKATQGTTQDASAVGHAQRILAAGKCLGLYHFFEPRLSPNDQFVAFNAAAKACKYGFGENIVPAIDIEYHSGNEVTQAWNKPLQELVVYMVEGFGGEKPLLYLNFETWVCLGRPSWALECHLWVPWYMREGLAMPQGPLSAAHVPGNRSDWAIWQFGAGRLFGSKQEQYESYSVDQDRANHLPLISGERVTSDTPTNSAPQA